MTNRVAELGEIVPVRMRPNDHIDRPPPRAPDPDVGLRWGRASQFRFSAANPPLAENGGTIPPPMYVKRSRKIERETRIFSPPSPSAIDFQTYTYTSYDAPQQIPGQSVRFTNEGEVPVRQYSVKEETVQDIVGFTAGPAGATPHFRPAVWEIVLQLNFSYSPAPRFTSEVETEGTIP